MNIIVPIQMTVAEGLGPIPAPAPGLLVVNALPQTIDGTDYWVLDKTFAEIKASGYPVIRNGNENQFMFWPVIGVTHITPNIRRLVRVMMFRKSGQTIELYDKNFSADSDDDYPKATQA